LAPPRAVAIKSSILSNNWLKLELEQEVSYTNKSGFQVSHLKKQLNFGEQGKKFKIQLL